ncbi:MAG: methyltransferase domain-containing protein [Candidatus Saccharimonadales bacterium]
MMLLLLTLVVLALIACFTVILLFGAPYLPTLRPQVAAAIKLADLRSGQTLLELGCGDGTVLVAAARTGATVVGYELNPILALVCWLRTRRYQGRVTVICGDFFRADWPKADVIFTFLLPKYMKKLDTKIVQYKHKPVKLISFAFTVPGRKPSAELDGVYGYQY